MTNPKCRAQSLIAMILQQAADVITAMADIQWPSEFHPETTDTIT
jgi:hypothetical protein